MITEGNFQDSIEKKSSLIIGCTLNECQIKIDKAQKKELKICSLEQIQQSSKRVKQADGDRKFEIQEEANLPSLKELDCLKKEKSFEQLKADFSENEKTMASLSFNIEDLFRKINSLTQQIQKQPDINLNDSYKSFTSIQLSSKNFPLFQNQHKKEDLPKQSAAPLIFSISQAPKIIQTPTGISMRMFQAGQTIGYGKFGEVFQCRHKQSGGIFAMKKIFKSTIEQYSMWDQILIQLQASRRVNHPNIVKTYTAFTDEFHLFILSEYALGKELVKKKNCPESEIRNIIYQVLSGVKHMHENNITHRDLKLQNILISSSGVVKICDFGWASIIDNESKMNIMCGTLDYVTPQMVKKQDYTKEADLWSVGVLTYELFFGFSPFQANTQNQVMQKIQRLQYLFESTENEVKVSEQGKDFISKLLQPEEKRMKIEECFIHPFLSSHEAFERKENINTIVEFQTICT